jgi:hypothetical protein
MHRPSGIRGLAVVMLLTASSVACQAVGIDAPAEPNVHEQMPRWASFELRGDPEVTARDLRLAVDVLPDSPNLRSIVFPAGTVVRWSEGLSESTIRVVSTAPDCALDLALPPERSTPIVFHHEATPCWFESAVELAPVESGSLSATVTVQPWAGLSVEAVSLDEPRQPVPEPVPPDEGGLAQLSPLWPGRYEIVLRRGETVLERQTVDFQPTGPQDSLLVLTLDGIPD